MDPRLLESLIRTQALRIAPPGQLFWYTSGTVGPYYINTHFLYGGPEDAGELLAFIDARKGHEGFAAELQERVRRQSAASAVYRGVIERLVDLVRQGAAEAADCVSGGERRDWFFSAAVAEGLGLPHLLIFKDSSGALGVDGRVQAAGRLDGCRAVHVADLVTEASSYLRTWIPALRRAGGRMAFSANVVDRGQGGLAAIRAAGVPAEALVSVDETLFVQLRAAGVIDEDQQQVLVSYFRDPYGAMRDFLLHHPDFLRRSLRSADPRTSGRARMLVEQNPYGLDVQEILH